MLAIEGWVTDPLCLWHLQKLSSQANQQPKASLKDLESRLSWNIPAAINPTEPPNHHYPYWGGIAMG